MDRRSPTGSPFLREKGDGPQIWAAGLTVSRDAPPGVRLSARHLPNGVKVSREGVATDRQGRKWWVARIHARSLLALASLPLWVGELLRDDSWGRVAEVSMKCPQGRGARCDVRVRLRARDGDECG